MVLVLKFQAVGSLEYTFKLAEDDEKLESRCRRERMKKSQFPNMNKTLFKKFFMQEEGGVLQALTQCHC